MKPKFKSIKKAKVKEKRVFPKLDIPFTTEQYVREYFILNVHLFKNESIGEMVWHTLATC
jgi:hypothetical protein